jgi:hypothetical protein
MTEKLSLNLPPKRSTDSADETKMFFDQYFTAPLSFPANEVDAVLGFFTNRGFEKSAAQSIATVIMQQAKLDGIKVFEILDTLKGLNDIQISNVVTEIMNYNREKISTIGYKISEVPDRTEARNIIY